MIKFVVKFFISYLISYSILASTVDCVPGLGSGYKGEVSVGDRGYYVVRTSEGKKIFLPIQNCIVYGEIHE